MIKSGNPSWLLLAALVGPGGCMPSAPSAPGHADADAEARRPSQATEAVTPGACFENVAEQCGISFGYRNGQEAGRYSILETLGGGVGLLDYDRDGAIDLFLPGGGRFGPNETIKGLSAALYRNEGVWRFKDATSRARSGTAPQYSHGVAIGDYDSDGFSDVLVTGYGGVLLFRNLGDGTFVESSAGAGLTGPSWSTGAAWGDVNADGHLDLYLVHYVNWSFDNDPGCRAAGVDRPEVCSPRQFQGLPDRLFFSRGDGTFEDRSAEAGLRDDGKGLGVLIADVDLDGDLDVYVANDTTANFLYRNDGRGRFEEVGLISSTAYDELGTPDGSMGVDLGDFNGDGSPDLWVANFEAESFALYRNEQDAFFTHVSQTTGITDVGGLYVGWGTAFFDFDRDGDEDLVAANGHVMRFPVNAPVRQKPLLFENRRRRRYVNVAAAAGAYMASPHEGRGLAVGDLDRDGDLDLVISHVNEPVAVLSNESQAPNHWLAVRLVGTKSSRDATGAIVRLRSPAGTQMRQVKGGGSYLSSSDRVLFFGLGTDQRVDELEIRWPSGTTQFLRDLQSDRVITVVEGSQQI